MLGQTASADANDWPAVRLSLAQYLHVIHSSRLCVAAVFQAGDADTGFCHGCFGPTPLPHRYSLRAKLV
ncbi:hypothetical protein EVAR_67047_1 [Eumeta japonica]|uniref:Uncharacterized protein n=1 Tax=Eumeta variegata TaxID=151549 RepID=A0A4C2A9A5_EUMVA|nr:hypothetical protein EVAR_67047_1 [Eumeta japonica]